MTTVVSIESVLRANESLMRSPVRHSTMDSKNITFKVHTSFFDREVVIPRERLDRAIKEVMSNLRKYA